MVHLSRRKMSSSDFESIPCVGFMLMIRKSDGKISDLHVVQRVEATIDRKGLLARYANNLFHLSSMLSCSSRSWI